MGALATLADYHLSTPKHIQEPSADAMRTPIIANMQTTCTKLNVNRMAATVFV